MCSIPSFNRPNLDDMRKFYHEGERFYLHYQLAYSGCDDIMNKRTTEVMLGHIMIIMLGLSMLLSGTPGLSRSAGADPPRQSLTWNGTVYLDNSVNIPFGTLLCVEAGTTVEMEWNVDIFVHGSLKVDGTSARPVTFTRATQEDPWGSIHIYSDSVGSYIHHARLFGAEYGVRGDGGNFSVVNTTFGNCKYAMGAVQNSHIAVSNCTIDDSRFYSLYGQGSEVIFRDTVVGDRGQKTMYLTGQGGRGCRITYIDGEYNFGSLSIQDADTEVYRCWTTDVTVVDESDESLEGARVTFQRNNMFKEFEGDTGADGEIDDAVLTEIIHRKVGPTTCNPFTLTVHKDGYGDNISSPNVDGPKQFRVELYPVNQPPKLLSDVRNFTTFQYSPDKRLCDLRDHFEDDETPENELNYSVNFVSNPADVYIFVDDLYYLTINTTRNSLFNGVVSTDIRVKDAESAASVSNRIYITVTEVPLPPEVEEFPDLTLDEDSVMMTALYLYEYIDDPDSGYENLNIFISRNDHDENVDVAVVGDILRIIPAKDYFGEGVVEITASDGNFSDSDSFMVNVTPVNDAPSLAVASPKFGETVSPDITINGSAGDVDSTGLFLVGTIEGKEVARVSVEGDFSVPLDLSDYEGEEVWLYLLVTDGEKDSAPVQLKLIITDTSGEDNDGDGIPDDLDDDDDNDGVTDEADAFPYDPAASVDADGDGHPDEWNTGKAENDSTMGLSLDEFPRDGSEWSDRDGDGVGDNSDDFPDDPAASIDSDNDGAPDMWNSGMTGADSLFKLVIDAFPHDPAASVDTDGDGHPDGWNAGKTVADSTTGLTLDIFPNDPSKNTDDGVADDDNDTAGPGFEEKSPGFGITLVIVCLVVSLVVATVRRRR